MKRTPILHYSSVNAGWTWSPLTLDDGEVLEVFGDPDSACYEWLLRAGDTVLKHSDCGYGIPGIALRDGLLAYYGQPTSARSVIDLRPKQLAGVP